MLPLRENIYCKSITEKKDEQIQPHMQKKKISKFAMGSFE